MKFMNNVTIILTTTFHRSHGFITSPSFSKSFFNIRRSSFSRSHSKLPLKQQHRLRPPPSSTTALNLGNDGDEEARSDSNLNIDQRVKHLTGMTETDITCMQAEGIAKEEDLRNVEFDDLPDSLPVVKRRKLNLVSRYLAAGNELNDTITMIQVQQTVETVIAATSSFVDISFDSASSLVTLIFDGDTDDPVRASASDMMNDQGISEVRAKDNSIPRGINMETLVSNKNMVGGSIKFGEQIFRINSSTKVEKEIDPKQTTDILEKELRALKQGSLEPQLVDELFTSRYGNPKVSNLQGLTIENFLNDYSRNDLTLKEMLRGWIRINSLSPYFLQERIPNILAPPTTLQSIVTNVDSFDDKSVTFMDTLAKKYRSNMEPTDYCHPQKFKETWKETEMKHALCEATDEVAANLALKQERLALVVAVVQGMGNGKTHFLLEAPRLLNLPGIYIAYNGGQNLNSDVKQPGKCLLLRILFATFGTKSFGASSYLNSQKEQWTNLSTGDLLEFTKKCLIEKYPNGLCICVDELRKIFESNGNVQNLLSTLAQITRSLYEATGNARYLGIVTALTDSTIVLSDGRGPTMKLALPAVDDTAFEFIYDHVGAPKEQLWKVKCVSGYHLRSIVISSDILAKGNSNVDILNLIMQTYERLACQIETEDVTDIITYLKECCKNGGNAEYTGLTDRIKILSSKKYALPPAILYTALKELGGNYARHVEEIFKNDIWTSMPKQLEKSAMHYDLLRAELEVGVVPKNMNVGNKHDYKTLTLSRFSIESDQSLFKCVDKKVTWTGLSPKVGTYYHPSDTNHPWVDRFYVIRNEEDSNNHWIVLIQDKVNKDISTAVEKLNLAYDMIGDKFPDWKVFCIVNVIGAGADTRKQDDIRCPYLFVGDEEIEKFYTVHFAPAFRFLRERWLIAN